jgi:NADP-dependent 3-hydroxy acid dehydrogenase YdfG
VTYTSKDATDAVKPISEKYSVPIHVYRCPGEESKVVDEVVEKASKEVGEIDIVVVNAGTSPLLLHRKELTLRCINVEGPYRLYRWYVPVP